MAHTGYIPKFKFRKYIKKGGYWLNTYSFVSPVNKCEYIIEALYYEDMDLFLIKFYNKNSGRGNKYAVVTNKGDVRNILMTNYNLMVDLLKGYPVVSFCFMGERRYYKDEESIQVLVEKPENNIRYRVYKLFIEQTCFKSFIERHFIPVMKDRISGYLLLNRDNSRFSSHLLYEAFIKKELGKAYPELNFTA